MLRFRFLTSPTPRPRPLGPLKKGRPRRGPLPLGTNPPLALAREPRPRPRYFAIRDSYACAIGQFLHPWAVETLQRWQVPGGSCPLDPPGARGMGWLPNGSPGPEELGPGVSAPTISAGLAWAGAAPNGAKPCAFSLSFHSIFLASKVPTSSKASSMVFTSSG